MAPGASWEFPERAAWVTANSQRGPWFMAWILKRDEKGSTDSASSLLDEKGLGSGNRLVVCKDYLYGSDPDSFAIDRISGGIAHGGFPLEARRGTCMSLMWSTATSRFCGEPMPPFMKVVELPSEVIGSGTDLADLAVDENGIV